MEAETGSKEDLAIQLTEGWSRLITDGKNLVRRVPQSGRFGLSFKSGHQSREFECLLCAKSRLMRCSKNLFDRLVGPRQQGRWHNGLIAEIDSRSRSLRRDLSQARSATISALWRGGMLQEGMALLPWCGFLADALVNGLANVGSLLPPPRWFPEVFVAPPEESY